RAARKTNRRISSSGEGRVKAVLPFFWPLAAGLGLGCAGASLIRRFAAVAAFLTVILIVAGGVVTNTDSGLACPDWPTCFGSVVPRMAGNVAVEHTHRLIATAVGLLAVALVILTLRRAAVWMAGFCVVLLGGAVWAARVKHVS